MMTKELIDAYLEFKRENTKESTIKSTIRPALNSLMAAEKDLGKSLSEFSNEDLSMVFIEKNWLGKSFGSKKTIVKKFTEWDSITNGVSYEVNFDAFEIDDEAQLRIYKTAYFPTEDSFVAALRFLLSRKGKLIRGVALCALYWIGFSREEVANTKINDMDDERLTICGRTVSRDLYQVIKDCANATSYSFDGAKTTMTREFANTGYIIRPSDYLGPVSGDILTPEIANKQFLYIREEISSLPKGNKLHGKKFKQKCLKENGKFCKMHDYELSVRMSGYFKSASFSEIEEFFRDVCYDPTINSHNYKGMINSYELWKKCYGF